MSHPVPSKNATTELRFLRLPDVRARTGLSRSEIYRRIADQSFPEPVKIGQRSSAWASSEVDQWIAAVLDRRNGGRHG